MMKKSFSIEFLDSQSPKTRVLRRAEARQTNSDAKFGAVAKSYVGNQKFVCQTHVFRKVGLKKKKTRKNDHRELYL